MNCGKEDSNILSALYITWMPKSFIYQLIVVTQVKAQSN
nr:MAG TPA: hypothetical protein [Caudoviricetes sp.]